MSGSLHRSRRSTGGPSPGRRKRRVLALGIVVVVGLVLGGLGMGWIGVRGPRFLESWPGPDSGFTPWETLEPGVEYARAHRELPHPVKAHVLRVDLQHPAVEMTVPWGDATPNGTRTAWATTWVRRHDLVAAVNGTPFTPDRIWPGNPVRLLGLAVTGSVVWSWPAPNLDAVIFPESGPPAVVRGGQALPPAVTGLGGFVQVLRQGQMTPDGAQRDAATFVGWTMDGRWLVLLVVDGRQPGYSEGVTPAEGAGLLRELGVTDALRLDGGSSSTLVVSDRWWGARVLNRPASPLWAGVPRPVGNVLGVRRRAPTPP